MQMKDYWRLTVSYWPSAVEAGLRPCIAIGFPKGDQFYSPHDLDFKNPPSREEFLQVALRTHWMATCWKESLLPIIEMNDWPMIGSGKRGSHVELSDNQKRFVGKLDVWRHDQFQNQSYGHCSFSLDERDKAIRGLKGDKLHEARQALDTYDNRIFERIIKEEVHTSKERILIMQHVLHELGIRASKPKAA